MILICVFKYPSPKNKNFQYTVYINFTTDKINQIKYKFTQKKKDLRTSCSSHIYIEYDYQSIVQAVC